MKTKKKQWWYEASEKLPIGKALLWILLPTILICGSATIGFSYYKIMKLKKAHDHRYDIVAIVQTGPEREQLKTLYFAELLDLSVDNPINIFAFDVAKAKKTLLSSPVIKNVEIKKVLPGTIYIDYEIRQPIAFLTDFSNTAVDSEKVAFPFKPFFSPKNLPKITLGERGIYGEERNCIWGECLNGEKMQLAYTLLTAFNRFLASPRTDIIAVDVSKAMNESFGRREAVVVFEERFKMDRRNKKQLLVCPVILRLAVNNIEKSFHYYSLVKQKILAQVLNQAALKKEQAVVRFSPLIIDLRVPSIALLSNPGTGK